MRYFRYAFMIVLFFLGLSFACLNAQSVKINYYLGEETFSLPFLLVSALLLGALLGFFVSLPALFRFHHENRKIRKQLQLLETEISNLRSLPILTKSVTIHHNV
jgi:lipopolysaccharide assembly protein A